MILLVAFAVTLASVPLCGGRLSRLGQLELHHSWLIVTALAVQTLVISVIPGIGAGLVVGGAILIHTTCETRLTRAPAAGQTVSRSAR